MTVFINSDPQQTRKFTRYPFDQSASLSLGKYTIDPSQIISLSITVRQAVFPLYIGKIQVVRNSVRLHILSFSTQSVGVAYLDATGQAAIKSQQGDIIGSILYNPVFYHFLQGIISTDFSYSVQIENSVMPLSPECITCLYTVGCRSIKINDIQTQKNTQIVFQRNAVLKSQTLNVYGDQQQPLVQKYSLKKVNGVDLTDKILIIKPRTLSDLRVLTSSNNIVFAGVRDAE